MEYEGGRDGLEHLQYVFGERDGYDRIARNLLDLIRQLQPDIFSRDPGILTPETANWIANIDKDSRERRIRLADLAYHGAQLEKFKQESRDASSVNLVVITKPGSYRVTDDYPLCNLKAGTILNVTRFHPSAALVFADGQWLPSMLPVEPEKGTS